MYNIPIDRVCVFNCEAIGVINDAVGGVEVTIENDFTDESGEVLEPEFYKGNTLKLTGEQAVTFIRERDCSIFKSAMDRVERQEQYISSLVSTAKSKLKRNPMIALSILNKLKENDCIYTDISASELMYIAQLAGRTHFSMYKFRSRDFMYLLAIVIFFGIVIVGMAMGVTDFSFYPEISNFNFGISQIIVYISFALLSFIPFVSEVWEVIVWKYSVSKI